MYHCLSGSGSGTAVVRGRQEESIYTHKTLTQVLAGDPQAACASCHDDIIDLRDRFVENTNSWHMGFLRFGEIGPLSIPTMVSQPSSGPGSKYFSEYLTTLD